jgi:hypothetical protein
VPSVSAISALEQQQPGHASCYTHPSFSASWTDPAAITRSIRVLPMMTSSPPANELEPARLLRGRLFTDLDRLAFALEMEAAQLLEAGREADAERRQQQRLGVRLAQRLVADVWADEVQVRIKRWSKEYDARLADPGS